MVAYSARASKALLPAGRPDHREVCAILAIIPSPAAPLIIILCAFSPSAAAVTVHGCDTAKRLCQLIESASPAQV